MADCEYEGMENKLKDPQWKSDFGPSVFNKKTPEALKARISKKSIALFEDMKVMSKIESEARYEIEIEAYIMHIQIESRVLGDIARNHIVPTAVKYQNILIENVKGLKEIFEKDGHFR